MVVAETFEQARDAATLVTTTYSETMPNTSLEAGSPDQPVVAPPGSPPLNFDVLAPGVSSIDAALAASAVVVEASFHQPIQHQVAMEPHAAVAEWNAAGTQVTVHTGSQMPAIATQLLAARLGVAPPSIHVVCTYTGGGFGSRVMS